MVKLKIADTTLLGSCINSTQLIAVLHEDALNFQAGTAKTPRAPRREIESKGASL
ncbi:hypothetical protein [Scytonema sp. NUACC21]